MPKRQTQAIQILTKKYLEKARKLEEQNMHSKSAKIYEELLELNHQVISIILEYSGCLSKLHHTDKAISLLQYAIRRYPNQSQIYFVLIKLLNNLDQFDEVKRVIKEACRTSEECRKDPKFSWTYAQASHRTQTFQEGIQMLKWYENNYKEVALNTENILLWRVYLCYQLGEYKQAVLYSGIILKLPNLESDDIWYYQFQKCKYYALMGEYQSALSLGSSILNQSARNKSKLKVYAIKAYCLLQTGEKSKALALLDSGMKNNPSDTMLLLKWSLFQLMAIDIQTLSLQDFNILAQNQLKPRLRLVASSLAQCSQTNFDQTIYSEHFNWYTQLDEYRNNLEMLITILGEPGIHKLIQHVIDFGLLLFLSLLQGFEDCKKTNIRLKAIQQHIRDNLRTSDEDAVKRDAQK